MSGKSTFLRSIGMAAVAAQAGAVVCAESLRMSPLRVGASLRAVDSVQEGASRFFAEIKRIKLVVDLVKTRANDAPALYLLDEVLHGTNSDDRLRGARGITQSMLREPAIGLITTHDLAITKLAEESPRATNAHFQDHIEQGKMKFDYKLREGVVSKSNAVELMRMVGLDV
jgi:DNA mismatch repair ATPase MutS